MEFFNNKENNLLKFKINSEGIDVNNIETRLIFKTNENNNYLLFGRIVDNICEFDVPELKLYETNEQGNVKFEIISGDTYFNVWTDEFDIKTKVNITLENIEEEIEKVNKPTIESISPIVVQREDKPKKESLIKEDVKIEEDSVKVETEVIEKPDTSKDKEEITKDKKKEKETKKPIKENKSSEKTKKKETKKDNDTIKDNSEIFTFDDFMNKK